MRFEDYKKIIDEMKDVLQLVLLWNYGEPFLNKEIFNIVQYTKKHGIRVETCTNANFLNEKMAERIVDSGLNKITIPIDGTTQKSHSIYRVGGKLDKVISGIKLLVEKRGNKNTPEINVDFIVMKHNEKEIPAIKDLVDSLGVDHLNFKTLNVYGDFKLGKEFLPKGKKFSRYSSKKSNVDSKFCPRLWDSSVINWDGSVSPCCYDFDCNYNFGNVFEKGFKKIWNNKKYVSFRKQIIKGKNRIELCKNCPADYLELYIK